MLNTNNKKPVPGKKPEYSYQNPQIKKETGKFRVYLQEKRYATNTIKPYINYTGFFLDWMERNNLTTKDVTYNDILEFIEHCREKGKGSRLINRILSSVRHYYNYLAQEKPVTNPVAGVYLKGASRPVPVGLTSFEELEELYRMYKATDNRTKRNKVILGVLIYQYPTVSELKNLQTTDINLQEGTISIPGGRKSNHRVLKLKPFQVIDLQEYILKVRPKLIAVPTKQLFISVNGSRNIKNSILHMFRAIKKINPNIKSPTQIRMSAISHLQKTVPLRKLQYMAGHRHISSTERYRQADTEELYKQLELFHPLN